MTCAHRMTLVVALSVCFALALSLPALAENGPSHHPRVENRGDRPDSRQEPANRMDNHRNQPRQQAWNNGAPQPQRQENRNDRMDRPQQRQHPTMNHRPNHRPQRFDRRWNRFHNRSWSSWR